MIVFRGDLQEFVVGNVGDLKKAFADVPDDYEFYVNSFGNIAIGQWQPKDRLSPDPNDTMRYHIGYYDVATGVLDIAPDTRYSDEDPPPGYPAQSWTTGKEIRYTAGVGGEMYLTHLETPPVKSKMDISYLEDDEDDDDTGNTEDTEK